MAKAKEMRTVKLLAGYAMPQGNDVVEGPALLSVDQDTARAHKHKLVPPDDATPAAMRDFDSWIDRRYVSGGPVSDNPADTEVALKIAKAAVARLEAQLAAGKGKN